MSLIKYYDYNNGIKNVNNVIDLHLQNQPKTICCEDCGRDLKITKKDIDIVDNIHVQIERCTCRDVTP